MKRKEDLRAVIKQKSAELKNVKIIFKKAALFTNSSLEIIHGREKN